MGNHGCQWCEKQYADIGKALVYVLNWMIGYLAARAELKRQMLMSTAKIMDGTLLLLAIAVNLGHIVLSNISHHHKSDLR